MTADAVSDSQRAAESKIENLLVEFEILTGETVIGMDFTRSDDPPKPTVVIYSARPR